MMYEYKQIFFKLNFDKTCFFSPNKTDFTDRKRVAECFFFRITFFNFCCYAENINKQSKKEKKKLNGKCAQKSLTTMKTNRKGGNFGYLAAVTTKMKGKKRPNCANCRFNAPCLTFLLLLLFLSQMRNKMNNNNGNNAHCNNENKQTNNNVPARHIWQRC